MKEPATEDMPDSIAVQNDKSSKKGDIVRALSSMVDVTYHV